MYNRQNRDKPVPNSIIPIAIKIIFKVVPWAINIPNAIKTRPISTLNILSAPPTLNFMILPPVFYHFQNQEPRSKMDSFQNFLPEQFNVTVRARKNAENRFKIQNFAFFSDIFYIYSDSNASY